MEENEIRKKRIENEEKQEDMAKISRLLERKTIDCEQLFATERRHQERVATYFQKHEEFSFFEEIIEDTRIEERRFFDEMSEGQAILTKEKRRLADQAETLYEAELQALREEADVDGQNGDW